MSLAYEAMMFAREAHKDQKRKYTGDIRTTERGLIDAMRTLYACGLRVEWIAECCGIPPTAIRNFVANKGLSRDMTRFHEAPPCLAEAGEEFRQIPWAMWYYASDFGRVIGMSPTQPGRLVRSTPLPNGYMQLKLTENDGAARHNYLHRTVLRVFKGEPDFGLQGAHGDGDKSNNRLNNLRWATPTENAADKALHGTLLFGSLSPHAKLNEVLAASIKRRLDQGERQCDVAESLQVPVSRVANIAQNKTWKHVEVAS